MSGAPHVLLTNDDGIESQGLRALYDELREFADVSVVAPASDQSSTGRALTYEARVEERDLGYAVAGTPGDCVIAGLEALVTDADLVVAGCNVGANIGMYVLGRSGTVSAAVEASFFDVPAIATSLYVTAGTEDFEAVGADRASYGEATRATRYLAERAVDAGVFEHADYLNVNAPTPGDARGEMRVTEPSRAYDTTAHFEDGSVRLEDRMWDRMLRGDVPDPEGTDRRAVVDGYTSVSPLTAPHTTERHEALDGLAASYD